MRVGDFGYSSRSGRGNRCNYWVWEIEWDSILLVDGDCKTQSPRLAWVRSSSTASLSHVFARSSSAAFTPDDLASFANSAQYKACCLQCFASGTVHLYVGG